MAISEGYDELFAGGQSKSFILQMLKYVIKCMNSHSDSSGITRMLKVKHISKCLQDCALRNETQKAVEKIFLDETLLSKPQMLLNFG